jgi:tRNA nucleotidyltransferase (CCA-adding enzyme)
VGTWPTVPVLLDPSNTPTVPSSSAFAPVLPLARHCREQGGRALLVGGAVRDWLLERHGLLAAAPGRARAPLDLDVEVHGLAAERLEAILTALGPVSLVGRAFSVWRMSYAGVELDVSLPRRDNKVRPGHRGIRAVGDPSMGLAEAARRRDLTVNAIAYDPLTDEIVDPFDGEGDLRRRLLRAVDPDTFTEDPLRALRVPQFAARFRFTVDPALLALCARVPIHELPAERIHGELRKLLLLPSEPSWGLRVGVTAQLWRRVHPALEQHDWEPIYRAVDRAVPLRDGVMAGQLGRSEALMLGALLHRVERASLEGLLDRLDVHRAAGFPLRAALLASLERVPTLARPLGDGQLRLLAREAQRGGGLRLWLALAQALGRPWGAEAARAEALGVGRQAPEPVIRGRHLRERGLAPGPQMGALLERLYVRQLTEGIEDPELLLAELESERSWPTDGSPG